MYLYSAEGTIFTIISILFQTVKIALPILAIIFLIKGIKYINKKNNNEKYQAYQHEKKILDDLEQEINSHND